MHLKKDLQLAKFRAGEEVQLADVGWRCARTRALAGGGGKRFEVHSLCSVSPPPALS